MVVCQHGRNGVPADVIEGDKPAYHDFAAKLAERGFITFAPHNPYRGEDRYRFLSRKANAIGASLFSFILVQHEQILNWLEALPLKMISIQYEELVADLEGQSRRLIDFLGLPWESGCLDFHKNERPVLTASVVQVRQPIYTRSVGRWKHYEKHLGPLLAALKEGGTDLQ